MALSKLKDAQALTIALEGERQGVEDKDFKLISEYLLPQRGYWPMEGDSKQSILERGRKNINPAATQALERAAGGLTTGMTPEGQPWFGLLVGDQEVDEAAGVKDHLAIREDKINAGLRDGGFYQSVHLGNVELFGFGGIFMFADRSDETVVRFEAPTVGTYCVSHDSEGRLDTVVRRLQWRVKDIKDKFGEAKLSKSSKELLKTTPYTKVDIVHVVQPRAERDDTKIDNLNMKYSSILYEDVAATAGDEEQQMLSESGYHEMPYFYAPYAEVGDSDYGMGTGHLLFGHSKQLNETERLKVVALQKGISPPVKKPKGLKGRMNVGPGQETTVSATESQGVGALYQIPIQFYQYALQEIADVMKRISAVSKADLFSALPDALRPTNVTATEWLGEERKRLQQIAPVVSIYEPKILAKVIERVNNMYERAGMFPPAPPALIEAGNISIEYMSSVAKSLRQVGAESTQVFLSSVESMVKLQVEAGVPVTALHKVNLPQALDEIAKGVGVPARVLNDDVVYEELVAVDLQRQAQAQRAAQANEDAKSMAQVGSIGTKDTVAGEMAQQGQA